MLLDANKAEGGNKLKDNSQLSCRTVFDQSDVANNHLEVHNIIPRLARNHQDLPTGAQGRSY